MSWLRMALARLRRSVPGSRIDEEIASHLDLLAADFERRGMTEAEARLAARRQFGGATRVAEEWREQCSLPLLETLGQDLRYAVRQMLANPGFTAAAVLTLALGIGANTAIFRVLDAVVLRSLPVRNPEQLVLVTPQHNGNNFSFTYPLFREMAARQQLLSGMFAFTDIPVREASVPGLGPLPDLKGKLVTGSYFGVLGVEAFAGRVFTEQDDRSTAAPAAVISYAFWQRAFGGKPDTLGRTVRANQANATIVGIAPPGFFGERVGSAPDVWLPMSLAPQAGLDILNSRGASLLAAMGRLGSDVPLQRAQAALDVLIRQLRDYTIKFKGRDEYGLKLEAGSQGVRDLQKQFSRPLVVLMGIVGMVLLIACSNLANLLLARATARTHEIGVRLALGASRMRLVRQLLTEAALLAIAGGAAGAAIAVWGSRALVQLASGGAGWRLELDGGWRILASTAILSGVAIGIFALAPALAATRLDVQSALQAHRSAGGAFRARTAKLFVVAQVAISVLLLAGAALLVRSFWNIYNQDFGYRREGVLMVQIPFDLRSRQDTLAEPIFEHMNSLPGVRSAALASVGPLSPIQSGVEISLPDRPASSTDEGRLAAVSARYFESMGISILAGRPLNDSDRQNSARVTVLSETAARRIFGGANPVGSFVSFGPTFEAQQALEVVGVAHDVRFSGPRDPFGVVAYVPLGQRGRVMLSSVVLRTTGDPAALIEPARQAMREAAPDLRIARILPLGGVVDSQLQQERMMALLSGAFGLLALVLAAVGLYGVIAYGVERRTREIGIRLALGAGWTQVSGLLLRELSAVLAFGVALGTAGALALSRSLKAMLFGLTPHDPAMLLAAIALLTLVALAAGYVPARRAARLDPMNALRQE